MTKALVVAMLAAVSMKAETLVAKVTFPFVVSGVPMPAGEYKISPVGPGRYTIGDRISGKKVILNGFGTAGNASRGPVAPHLGFACTESRCALSQVWFESTGVENRKVREQMEAGSEPVQVAIVAMLR
jgi:hypothetical protein